MLAPDRRVHMVRRRRQPRVLCLIMFSGMWMMAGVLFVLFYADGGNVAKMRDVYNGDKIGNIGNDKITINGDNSHNTVNNYNGFFATGLNEMHKFKTFSGDDANVVQVGAIVNFLLNQEYIVDYFVALLEMSEIQGAMTQDYIKENLNKGNWSDMIRERAASIIHKYKFSQIEFKHRPACECGYTLDPMVLHVEKMFSCIPGVGGLFDVKQQILYLPQPIYYQFTTAFDAPNLDLLLYESFVLLHELQHAVFDVKGQTHGQRKHEIGTIVGNLMLGGKLFYDFNRNKLFLEDTNLNHFWVSDEWKINLWTKYINKEKITKDDITVKYDKTQFSDPIDVNGCAKNSRTLLSVEYKNPTHCNAYYLANDTPSCLLICHYIL